MSGPSIPLEKLTVHELFARGAAVTPSAIAVIDGERELTYEELNTRANKLAHYLHDIGVGSDLPVGVCLHRSAEQVIALLAVWKAGAAYVPLDPDHPRDRTQWVLAQTGACVVLTEESLAGLVQAAGVRLVVLASDLAVTKECSPRDPAIGVDAENAAYVLYTSGSTGRPKGVVISHGGIANRIDWTVRTHGLSATDRVLQKTALTFDAACWEVFAPLVSGGAVVLAPPGTERDAAAIVSSVIGHRITVLQVVPSVLRVLADEHGWDRATSLRLLCCAGEPLHAELVQRFLLRLGDNAAEVEVWNTYGPTECAIDVTAYRFGREQRSGPVPIGRPISGMRVLIMDASGQLAAIGARGELCAGGIGVGRGYLGRPDLTAERFVPDPYGPSGSRLYRTGDLARWRSDGNLEYLGRMDLQLKINGVRIEPGEVEAALAGHPAVRGAVVTSFAAPDGTARLAAYILDGGSGTPAGLRGFLCERLPATHIPSAFVAMKAFPMTSSGKVDRLALPAPSIAGAGEWDPRAEPRTVAEDLVAGLWREMFELDHVGVDDDFFRLGGSSLQFTRLANRLRAATGKEIELRRLLSTTTVAAQARLIGASSGDAPPVRPVSRSGALPLSFGQRRLWVLDRMMPLSREWVTGLILRVPAADIEMVRQTLGLLAARHESLRTRFAVQAGEPVQIIDPPGPVALETIDVSADGIGAVVDKELGRGIDLENGPIMRALVTGDPGEGAAGERSVVLLMHHIVCDGWSAAVLDREFRQVLAALRDGRSPDLTPPEIQYADYAAWQLGQITDDVMKRELSHWQAVLDGAAPLALRTDRPRPPARDADGGAVIFTVPAALTTALVELGRRHNATPFATLLTGFATLLARYSAQWDVVIGTPIAGRDRPELEGVVGFFLNSLVMRCQLDGSLTFDQALDIVRDVSRDAFAHQELPFEQLVADLAPDRDLSRTPLYQVAFDLHDEDLTGSASHPADLSTIADVSGIAKTDLTLYMRRQPDGSMVGGLEYATALFDHSTMQRMARHFLHLLSSVTSGPHTRLDALDFLPDDELRYVSELSCSSFPSNVRACVPDVFEERAADTPDALAVAIDGKGVSFRELDEQANRFAHYLRGLGTGQESVVGVLLDRGIDLLACLLGIWKAGAAYVPLDPCFPASRAGFVLADCGAQVVVTQSAYAERFDETFRGHVVLTDTHAERISAQPAGQPARHADLDSLAYVMYTSGSTGRPKGVQIPHRGLANYLQWAAGDVASRGTGGAAVFSSVAFDLGVTNLWAPLLAGRPVHMMPQDLDLADLGRRLVDAGPFSFVKLTPGHLDILSQQISPEQAAGLAQTFVVGGEALPVQAANRWALMLGNDRLINEYGPTEASVAACMFPVTAPVIGESVPIGLPMPGASVHVLDEGLRRTPIGVAGEVYLAGAGLARGYRNRPDLTAERFLPDPFGPPGSRIYRTGDLARVLPDGNVDLIGRIDSQVKIRGYRVEPEEVAVVLREHPAVRDAVVISATGEAGQEFLAAYYVAAQPPSSPDDLRDSLAARCAANLPEYMVPSFFRLIDAIPLTASGKIDRKALPPVDDVLSADEVAPRGVVEERIAEIFTELLRTQVTAHGNFFRLGGNSILAIRLIARLQSAFEVSLPIRAIFEKPTVAGLAEVVEAAVRAEIDQMSDTELIADSAK